MVIQLKKVRFGPDLVPAVLSFDCREDRANPALPWEQEINDWIKADPSTGDGARHSIIKYPDCRVWLYLLESEEGRLEVVGYSSLSSSKWPDPYNPKIDPKLPRVPISLIPAMGIQTSFQKGPEGAEPEERYSTQIMGHLIHEAREMLRERQPFLGLYLHPENHKAMKFYRRVGFVDFAQTWKDKKTGVVYRSMILSLQPSIAHFEH
jgi:GNAT superfamily N-acetyltransferase